MEKEPKSVIYIQERFVSPKSDISRLSEDDIRVLMKHEERLEVYNIGQGVRDIVRSASKPLMKFILVGLDELYDFLGSSTFTASYFRSEDSLKYAKAAKQRHWECILKCKFDKDYYVSVDSIGRMHAKINLPAHLYSAAYARIFESVCAQVSMSHGKIGTKHLLALNKLVSFDNELTLAAYYNHKLERAEIIADDLKRMRAHLGDP